jgi:hypothetical protein
MLDRRSIRGNDLDQRIRHRVHQSVHDGDSEWQYDKHDLHKCRTDDGIIIGENERQYEKHDWHKRV